MITMIVTSNNRLPKLIARIEAEVGKAVSDTADAIVADVAGGGPHAAPRDTGDLQASYGKTMTGPTSATVQNDLSKAYYALFVEFGHATPGGGFQPPQPHITPAAEAQRAEFTRRIGQAVDRAAT